MAYKYNPFTGELDLVGDTTIPPDVARQFDTDFGTAIPAANIINFFGDAPQGISSSGAGNSVTYTIADATESQKGVVELATNAEAIAGTASTNLAIIPSSLNAKLGAQTDNGVAYGDGTTSAIQWTAALTDGQLVIGSTAGTPAAANLSSSDSSITITNGANSIDLIVHGAFSDSFETDAGTATPSMGVIDIAGGLNINTAGATNVVTINLNNNITVVSMATADANTGLTITQNSITADGTDTNIDIDLVPKGTGTVNISYATENAVAIYGANGALDEVGPLTDGQLVIGSTGNPPSAATLTEGTGIDITNAAGSITINSSGGGLTWNLENGTTANMAVNNGYVGDNGAGVTFTLPATAAFGSIMGVTGLQASWTIAQNAGQTIHMGNQSTTTGVGGSLASTDARDVVMILCVEADTDFQVLSSIGNITVT